MILSMEQVRRRQRCEGCRAAGRSDSVKTEQKPSELSAAFQSEVEGREALFSVLG